MLNIRSTALLVFSTVFCSLPSYAGLIDNGFFTTDTATNTDWLDLTLTANKSYNEVVSGYGDYLADGWTYASEDQVYDLFRNAGARLQYFGFTSHNKAAAQQLGELLGFNGIYTYNGNKSLMSLGLTSTVSVGKLETPGFALSINGLHGDRHYSGQFAQTWNSTFDERHELMGSFLIRPAQASIPEPSTLAILAIGIAGLTSRRLSKK